MSPYSRKPWNYNGFVKKSSLTKILIDWVRLFHDINLKNNGVIVIPWFSTVCGSVRTSFGDISEKFTSGLQKVVQSW